MHVALVTGATGFCGTHLLARLRAEGGIRIVGTGKRREPSQLFRADDYLQMDMQDRELVSRCIAQVKPDTVYHLAGTSGTTAEQMYQTNLLGSVFLLEALRVSAPRARILLVGSAAEYGVVASASLPVSEDHPCQPVSAYGASKHAVTTWGLRYAQQNRMKVVVARPFNIIGPGTPSNLLVGAVVARAREALQSPRPPVVRVGNLDTVRDFLAVSDVVDAYVRMVWASCWGEVFNICSGRPSSVRTVVSTLLSFSSRQIHLTVDPTLFRNADTPAMYGNPEKARRKLGFRVTCSLERCLKETWEAGMNQEVTCV